MRITLNPDVLMGDVIFLLGLLVLISAAYVLGFLVSYVLSGSPPRRRVDR